MTTPVGFFRLQTPLDLLEKMEFNCEQLRADPMNAYAAFDFFVSAAHLPEWLGKFGCSQKIDRGKPEAMNDICQQLANGAKHFTVNPNRHDAVRATGVSTPAISGVARSGVTFSGATEQKLIVLLAPDEAAALDVPAISAVNLANMLLAYWKDHDGVKRAATLIQSMIPSSSD
jgi:hypothetical protein